jgi:hypothetical protein
VANVSRANCRGVDEEGAKLIDEKVRPLEVRTSGTLRMVVVVASQVMVDASASAIFCVSAGRTVFPTRKQGCA